MNKINILLFIIKLKNDWTLITNKKIQQIRTHLISLICLLIVWHDIKLWNKPRIAKIIRNVQRHYDDQEYLTKVTKKIIRSIA